MTAPWVVIVSVLTVVIGLAAWFAITRFRIGPILSPMSISLLVFVSIFGVRPLFLLRYDEYTFYGYDVRNGFIYAAWVGLVGICALIVGYSVAAKLYETSGRATSVPPAYFTVSRPQNLRVTCYFGAGLLVLWLAIQILLGGGVDYLNTLFAGRSEANTAAQAGVPSLVSALPVVSAILASSARILTSRARRLRADERLWFWIVIAGSTIPPTALGSRRFLIPTLLAAACAIAADGWSRRLRLRWAFTALVGFLILSAIPFIRSAGARSSETQGFLSALLEYLRTESIVDVLAHYFVSYDTEMFNYIALFHLDRLEGFSYGLGRASVGEFILNPLPARISPVLWSDQLLRFNFGGPCGDPYCPVLSTVGVFYTEGGIFATAAGMLLFGAALRFIELPKNSAWSGLLCFSLWVFTPAMARGNTPLILSIAVQVFVLVWVLHYFASRVGGSDSRADARYSDTPKLELSATRS